MPWKRELTDVDTVWIDERDRLAYRQLRGDTLSEEEFARLTELNARLDELYVPERGISTEAEALMMAVFMRERDDLAWRQAQGESLTQAEIARLAAMEARLDAWEPPLEPLPPDVQALLDRFSRPDRGSDGDV